MDTVDDVRDSAYRLQAEWEAKAAELPSCYTNPGSVGAWRHARMLGTVLPFVSAFPQATWMTVGDGSYGSDAFFLQQHGANVVATSLTDSRLKIAHERGFIQKYRVENAEHLSASDCAYDFVLCKEAYHHFPRPAIAFYEMLRVAKRAVILIEPMDDVDRVLDRLKTLVKRVVRGDRTSLFEPSGNFVYRVNIHEIEKALTALSLPCMAIKKFNDMYLPALSHQTSAGLSLGSIITRLGIGTQNVLSHLRLLNYGLVALIAYKALSPQADQNLIDAGFQIRRLPSNPYLQSGAVFQDTGPEA